MRSAQRAHLIVGSAWNAELAGDRIEGEHRRQLGDEIALPAGDEPVDDLVREGQQCVLVEARHCTRTERGRCELAVSVVLLAVHADERAPDHRLGVHAVRRASGEVHVVPERLAHVVVARDGDGIHAEEPDGADATTRPQLGQHEVQVLPRERVDPEIDGRPCRQVRHGRHRTVPPDIGVSLPEYTSAVRGIISAAGYVPYWRLDRSQIAATFGSGGGKGTRAVASYDEDTTTMGVEAARLALKSAPGADPQALTFATAAPAYLDKTNATAIHAALRLDSDVAAFDFGGAIRSSVGALRAALRPGHPVLVVSADIRDGQPTSGEESSGGDAAAAIILGSDEDAPVIAELLGVGTATDEFIDRWRTPGDRRSKVWEERFGETKYLPLGEQAWNAALKAAELSADQVDRLIVTGPHGRAVRALSPKLGVDKDKLVDDLAATVGYTGTAHVGVLLASTLEQAKPGEVIGVLSLADGADALIFRATDALASWKPARTIASQIDARNDVTYGKFLSWRGEVSLEGPRRPEPSRISAAAAGRKTEWKYAFVGSKDRSTGTIHVPPQRVSRVGGAIDDMEPAPMADEDGTIATFTIDRIAYSPSPPIVYAVVDFDNGTRSALELCDVDASKLAMGDRVELTFRKLFTADGIHNYFWKARPIRG